MMIFPAAVVTASLIAPAAMASPRDCLPGSIVSDYCEGHGHHHHHHHHPGDGGSGLSAATGASTAGSDQGGDSGGAGYRVVLSRSARQLP
jgi:hypothetical protein